MADQKISALPSLTSSLQAQDVLPVVDASASETKKVNAKHLVQSSIAIIDDESIPLIKVDTTGLTIDVPVGSIIATKLADDSSAVFGALPATGVFKGQIAVDSGTRETRIWSGSAWEKPAGVTSVAAAGVSPLEAVGSINLDGELSIGVGLETTSAARQFLAGPTNGVGNVSSRQIIGADLPAATTASLGAVSVGSGLGVSVGGSLSISNTVAASTDNHLVTYDANGLVTGGRAITGTDLPVATALNPGVVSAGHGLSIGVDAALNITNQIVPGTGTKFTCDAQGNITDILVLTPADIPDISAEKLTSGLIDPARIGSHSLERQQLADYSISFIQEAAPSTLDASLYAGCLWFQESTAQLRMWNQNAWTAIGFGRLSADNLRFGGTIDASTGNVTGVTSAGTTAGLTIGTDLPTATDALGGLYLVVDIAGSNINVTPGLTYDPGDWVLCISKIEGWVRINTLSGGGGGGSDTLADLLDTQISAPSEGDVLVYSASALWTNEAVLSGGTY